MGTPVGRVSDHPRILGFLFDENIPPAFADALQLVGCKVISTRAAGLDGKDDPDLIVYCGDQRLVWVTKDMDARKKATYAGLVRTHQVSAVFLSPPRARGWSVKEQFEVIIKHLRSLEGRYEGARKPRYFVCRATGQAREAMSFAARPGRV